MRKLILAPMALACLIGAAQAQQQQKYTADQGAAGAAPWPVTWTGQSVLADLRVAGSPVATGNPVPVSVGNFPAAQAVTNAGAFAVQNTASLPAGANNIGTIGNAFALDATITARLGTLGQKAMAASTPVTIASDQPAVPIQGGNSSAVKTDSSATTQPVSAATLPLPTGAATSTNQSTEIAALQSLVAGTKLVAAFPFTETTTPLAAGATFTGSAHNTGTVNTNSIFAYVSATFFADQAGTAFLEQSLDASTWYPLNTTSGTPYTAGTAVAAGQNITIKAPATMNIFRVRFVNGSAAQTKFAVGSMFSTN